MKVAESVKAVHSGALVFLRCRHFYMTLTGEKRLGWSPVATKNASDRCDSARTGEDRGAGACGRRRCVRYAAEGRSGRKWGRADKGRTKVLLGQGAARAPRDWRCEAARPCQRWRPCLVDVSGRQRVASMQHWRDPWRSQSNPAEPWARSDMLEVQSTTLHQASGMRASSREHFDDLRRLRRFIACCSI